MKSSLLFISHKYILTAFLLVLMSISCEKTIGIDPNLAKEEILVFEGGISNQPPPYKISLRTAHNISGIGENTLGIGATITLFDDQGNSEPFIENNPGNYISYGTKIMGKTGNSYMVKIKLANGEEYQSNFDLMPEPVVVNNTYEVFTKDPIYNNELTLIGFSYYHKIFTEINIEQNHTFYVKPTQRKAIIEREVGLETGCEDFGPTKCFAVKQINNSNIYLTTNLNINAAEITVEIAKIPIEYKGLYYTKFSIEAISPSNFDYYAAIKQQLETAGTIFDPILPSVPSNIFGINGTERIAEGYFRAYAITWTEICYDRSNIDVVVDIPTICNFCVNHYSPAVSDLPPEMQNCK